MAESIKLFLANGEAKNFSTEGWTDKSPRSLSGKSVETIEAGTAF
jgi:hypothetical protein